MGWRDRSAGHAVLEDADFTALQDLPKPVAFQVRLFQRKKQKVWFIGTRSNVTKWEKDDDPFSEFAPSGSAKFVKLAMESAASFCRAFDELCAFEKEAFDPEFMSFGPSKKVGELSLGLQIASLLGKRVYTFIDDDDPMQAILACTAEPDRIARIRCDKSGIHFLFDDRTTTVSRMTNFGNIPPIKVTYPEGHTPPPVVDMAPVLERLARISGVKKGKQPADYFGWNKQLVSQELNVFVDAEIAEPDTVVPSYTGMKLLAQRAAGGKVKVF
jgi:hypothetical protein